MKKRILVVLSCCVLAVACVGCGTTYQEATNISTKPDSFANGYFTVITEWGNSVEFYRIVYANDTKVKYLEFKNRHRGGITPLYNADGTLQIYDN